MTDEDDTMRRDIDRYLAAAHAMQTGVAHQMQDPSVKETQPKHLRVGVNSALVSSGALAKLLIQKGVITEAEFLAAQAEGMEAEAEDYTARVRVQYGSDNINLS